MAEMTALERQWRLLQAMIGLRNGGTVAELAVEFQVSEKTIRRDLSLLLKVGFPLSEIVGRKGLKRCKVSAEHGPPAAIRWDEAATLYLGCKLMQPLAEVGLADSWQSLFRVVGYRRATEPSQSPFTAFSILKPDASGIRSFDTMRRTRDVAGMIRHVVAKTAHDQGWPEDRINVFIHGKTPDGSKPSSGEKSPDRFQYLPLPTINHALGRVESIRRVLIVAPSHCGQEIAWARRAMAGAELVNHNGTAALLTILPGSDWVLRQYVEESRTWATVTPVILPGYDDPDHLRRKLKNGRDAETQKRYLTRLDARTDELLRKAFRQAGYSCELIEKAELDWRDVGFQPGVELASRYLPPENLNNAPRIHVRVNFPSAVRGPIAVGSGRFRGFGLFTKSDR